LPVTEVGCKKDNGNDFFTRRKKKVVWSINFMDRLLKRESPQPPSLGTVENPSAGESGSPSFFGVWDCLDHAYGAAKLQCGVRKVR